MPETDLMGIPLSEWSGSGATDRLHETISEFSADARAQTEQMIRLTRWIARLTAIMVIAVIVQIMLAI
jgi:hypothetical protein